MAQQHPALTADADTLYVVDVSSFIFRAFFAIRPLTAPSGEPTNAVYGVATMLAKLLEDVRPHAIAIAYDSKEPSFRKEMYEDYKANRSEAPEDLVPQFDRIEQLISLMGLPSFRKSGVEADDLIATLNSRWRALGPNRKVVVVTGDKDLMQLVDSRTVTWDTMSLKVYDEPSVQEKFGIPASRVRDYLALVGDSSDNIPGVPSIGPKSAVDLLQAYGDLDGILEAAKAGKISGKKGVVLQEHREDALLSAKLATVRDDVSIPFDPNALQYRFEIRKELLDFLKEMGFARLVEKWATLRSEPQEKAHSSSSAVEVSIKSDSSTFRSIQDEKTFRQLIEACARKGEFAFDLETTSLNPREAEIVGVALAHSADFGAYIPVGHRGTSLPQLELGMVLQSLAPLLEDPKLKKVGQNLKYDWSVLRAQGLRPDGIGADTMVAAYVLEPEGRHNLERLASQYLDYQVMTYEQVCGKGKDQLGFDQVAIDVATRYSAEDAWITLRLWQKLQPMLLGEGLMPVFSEIDLPLVSILSEIEMQGVHVDSKWLAKLSTRFNSELLSIEERMQAFTRGPINLNSPKQLAVLLFDELKLPPQGKTKTGFSTDASVLEALSPLHEVPRLLLEYREIAKLKGTYVDPLPGLCDPKTGKVHASFHQTVAATGRLSSSDPNLQNIPVKTERGKLIRGAFVASPGNLLISADYSQVELRILAQMSQDPELCRSFIAGEDVHSRTASEIFHVPVNQVSEQQRGAAKAINFGLMYGKTPFGLAQELKISRTEAQSMIDNYFGRYKGVKKFLDEQVLEAKEKGEVFTLFGRRRKLADIRSANPAIRNNAERMAMNTPIQGTAADLMKIAMIRMHERLVEGGYGAKLIVQVHDEVLLDCPKDEVTEVTSLVRESMEGVLDGVVESKGFKIPLSVNAASGSNWMELS